MNASAELRTTQEQDLLNDLDPKGFETFDDIKEELREIEQKLATQLKIRRHVRRTLLALDRANKLYEDDVVARWHELYSRYVAWACFDTLEELPCEWEQAPCVSEDDEEGAADAALAVFVGTGCAKYDPCSQTGAISSALLPGIDHGSGEACARRVRVRIAQAEVDASGARRHRITSHVSAERQSHYTNSS